MLLALCPPRVTGNDIVKISPRPGETQTYIQLNQVISFTAEGYVNGSLVSAEAFGKVIWRYDPDLFQKISSCLRLKLNKELKK